MSRRSFALLLALPLLVACGDDDTSSHGALVPDTSDVGVSDTGDVTSALAVPEFGTDETRVFRAFATAEDGLMRPRDLEFDPETPENLWVASYGNDGMLILFDAGTEAQTSELRLDAFGNHFMEKVSSMAFGADATFATCQESRNTYNDVAAPNDFMGPALWPSDLDIFARIFQDPNGADLGSHLDMMHESPLCMGIAHFRDNAYFVFDGFHGNLAYYDFVADHGPGQHDHSDGIIRRHTDVVLTREADVPSHMEYHSPSRRIFIADTGTGRVLAVNAETSSRVGPLIPDNELIDEYSEYNGSTIDIVSDDLIRPSGLALHDGRLFVGDHATGEIVAYDMDTYEELGRVDTFAEELMGITVAPDGTLWMVDAAYDEVLRLEP